MLRLYVWSFSFLVTPLAQPKHLLGPTPLLPDQSLLLPAPGSLLRGFVFVARMAEGLHVPQLPASTLVQRLDVVGIPEGYLPPADVEAVLFQDLLRLMALLVISPPSPEVEVYRVEAAYRADALVPPLHLVAQPIRVGRQGVGVEALVGAEKANELRAKML